MFKGTITALVTPFKDSKIDAGAFEKMIANQIVCGIDGVVISGTTGESPNLSEREIDELFEIADGVRKNEKSRIQIIIGTGSNSTEHAVKKTKHSKKLGADAFLVVTPYYNKPTQAGIIEHYKAVAKEAGGTAVILYNVPGRTGCNMLPQTVERLAEIDNIMAVKEASGNLIQISEIFIKVCSKSRKGFTLLSGDDALTLPILSVGGAGVISVTSNIAPKLVKKFIDCFIAGDIVSAREMHDNLFELNNALFIEPNPIPVKTALAEMGLYTEEFRLPLCPMADKNKAELIKTLKKYKLV